MRSGIARLLLTLCAIGVASGCAPEAETITLTELHGESIHYRDPEISAWYYMGTKEGYHYFAHTDLPHERYYRVSEGELKWQSTAPLTSQRANWVELPWGVKDPNRLAWTHALGSAQKQ
jgi:hypothetical protein